MLKPIKLREHLMAALPRIAHNPELLKIFVLNGSVRCTATGTLSWEYSYTMQLQLLDWVDHPDSVMAPLLTWLQVHQHDLLANPDRKGIRFDAEYLNAASMDLIIHLDLTERVIARARQDVPGGITLTHVSDTPPSYLPMQEHWELFVKGEKVAEWNFPPSHPGVQP